MGARLGLLALFWVTIALADPPAPESPAPTLPADVAPVSCVQPVLPEAKMAAKDLKALDEQITAYGECIRRYVDERRAKAVVYISLQKSEADAANEAVQLVNDYFATVREFQEKQTAKSTAKAATK